jgi:hypothetical protein
MTKSGSILKPVEKKIAIATKAKFDPKEYYQTRNGLYVWGNFGERILSKTSPIKTAKKISIVSYELTKSASGESIEKALPKKHIFDESEVCAIISTMIDKQAKGEEGDLLNTGYANIFYTKAFVVACAGTRSAGTGTSARGGAVAAVGLLVRVSSLPQNSRPENMRYDY